MPSGDSLVCAITGCGTEQGTDLLDNAAVLGVDPLALVRSRFWIDETVVFERAAAWAGLTFAPTIPEAARLPLPLARIDALAGIRSLRLTLFDREVLFVAPDFSQFLALAEHVRDHPGTRQRICVVPLSEIRRFVAKRSEERLIEFSRQWITQKWPFATAHLDLTPFTRFFFIASTGLLLAAAVLAPFQARPVLVPLLFVLLVLPSWFRIAAIIDEPDPADTGQSDLVGDAELPVYSLLVPLRDEAHMVPQLVRALGQLDYPAEKLDVKFVVEADSPMTVAAVRRALFSTGFELITVPRAPPFTKPKALDYALPLTRGTFVVIYDAEDMPEPDQLRRTASLFLQNPQIGCIQAELVSENAGENALTALFAAEYCGQFGIMLPGLARWGFPMPLGGTSNHFRRSVLWEIGGWDAFNVTEDADLGLRLARRGIKCATVTSRTYEEAPVTALAWFRQRTRWMKGWMQTFLVHNRRPSGLLGDLGPTNFIALEIYLMGMILTPPLHTLYLVATVIRFASFGVVLPDVDILSFVEAFTLVSGYLSAVLLSIFGLIRLGQTRLIKYQVLLPLYWALMGLASFKAAYELVHNPYFWSKTSHGISKITRSPQQVAADAFSRRREVTGEVLERMKGIEPSS